MACLIEASAPKPGNVNRFHDFGDARLEDWLLSAAAIGPAMGAAGTAPIGETILGAIRDTRRWTAANTNLGIVLLLAPLARAAARDSKPLRRAVGAVLRETTVADAEAVYQAVRLAQPGGLGRVEEQDVAAAPTLPLHEVMALAAGRDTIAREYTTSFAVTFETALPPIRAARQAGQSWSDAAVASYLATLSDVPDTLIARKRGATAAAEVSRDAARVLAAGEPGTAARGEALARFDAALRSPDNALNPGTTADLVAAALFIAFLDPNLCAHE